MHNEQFIPIPSYRVGPYAAGGTSLYGGFIDYLNLINMRDGGINGVKLTWEECETEYKPDRGVECYERLKGKGPTGASMFTLLQHRHHLRADRQGRPRTRFRWSPSPTAGPTPRTAGSSPTSSRSSPTTGA